MYLITDVVFLIAPTNPLFVMLLHEGWTELDCNKLEAETELCKKEIAAFRREINTILDEMENNIIESLKAKANEQLHMIGM